jgi:hypothetical protein
VPNGYNGNGNGGAPQPSRGLPFGGGRRNQ